MEERRIVFWLKPLLTLLSLCAVLIAVTFLLDKHFDGRAININYLGGLFSKDAGTLANVLGGLTQVAPAILGITITVIAIIVEMASNKYSPKVMDLFVTDPVNFWMMGLFVITSVYSIWVAHIATESFFPIISIVINGIMVTFSLVLVIPYFTFIFDFLHPHSFITYVNKKTLKILDKLANKKLTAEIINEYKIEIHGNIDFIGDIAVNAVNEGDRAVAQFCCNKLSEMTSHYLELKNNFPYRTFLISELESSDPDFIDFSDFVIDRIETKRIWLERKILRLYEIVFNVAREQLRTTASSVLLNTLQIGKKAILTDDKAVIFTVMQYFNTFLRFSINFNDPRSAFNILEHYRNFAESLIAKFPEEVENVAFFIKYYAHEAQKRQVLFILETAAHDICRLIEMAHSKNAPNLKNLLDQFLKLDQPIGESSSTQQELSLIGVRLAQAKLAAYFINNGETDLAKYIYEDMSVEPIERINKMRNLIAINDKEEFWEITGRGVNFFFISLDRREGLEIFFKWFVNE